MIEAKPLTEQQCIEANLIPKGIYPAQVLLTQEKHSPKVGGFLSLKLRVNIGPNRARQVFDGLFFSEEMMWKTRHFYRSANRMDIYESGKFMAQDCDGLDVHVQIEHRTNKQTGEIESYIKDYITPEHQPELQKFDDELPPSFN